MQVGRQFE